MIPGDVTTEPTRGDTKGIFWRLEVNMTSQLFKLVETGSTMDK